MTNYSERSLQLAAELRKQALRNLGRDKQATPKPDRLSKGGDGEQQRKG